MTYGAGLVVLGMVLNSLIGDANADKGSIDAKFGEVTCRKLIIEDGDEIRAVFGLDGTDLASLSIFNRGFNKGDTSYHKLVYLGTEEGDEEVYENGKIVGKKKVFGRCFVSGKSRFDEISVKKLSASGIETIMVEAHVVESSFLQGEKFFGEEFLVVEDRADADGYDADGYYGKHKGMFGLSTNGNAILKIYDDDGETPVAYLGENKAGDDEILFLLRSKSKTDKRRASIMIGENGGRFDSFNKLDENVVRLVVGANGGGSLDLRDKHGYTK
jgi:hypothetical protein